jgi:hypothetical protein
MANYRTARIIPVAFILIIVALAIAALFSMARVIFFPDAGTNSNTAKVGHDTLISSTADCSVKMTVRGPIISEEEFRSYQITVSPNQRQLVTYQGYVETAIDRVNLSNNIPAYEEFVYALDDARMMTAPEFKGNKNDQRGVCARGYLYVFSVSNEGKLVKELWTTSCADERGSLGIKALPLTKLFNYQIPESKTIINKLWR